MKTILFCLVLLSGCTTMPAYNITAKIAVDRAVNESIRNYGVEAVKQSIARGHIEFTPAGSALLTAIEHQKAKMVTLSRNTYRIPGLPKLRATDNIREDFIMKWVEAKL